MPIDVVDSLFEASPYAVAAALTRLLPRFGWHVTNVGDYGRSVTWSAFDARVELVALQAEILTVPGQPRLTRLRVSKVDQPVAPPERLTIPRPREGNRQPRPAVDRA